MKKLAEISKCGTYRYTLVREWDAPLGYALFICLNPSTADAFEDDPTVRRMIGFAERWGYGAMMVVNLFAYRSKNPTDLYKKAEKIDVVGPGNDDAIERAIKGAGIVVAAWGYHGSFMDRDSKVRAITRLAGVDLHVLQFTKGKQPRHPLYLKKNLEPFSWYTWNVHGVEARTKKPIQYKCLSCRDTGYIPAPNGWAFCPDCRYEEQRREGAI